MNKQSKPTKRQMRNLKVVRWPNGQLFAWNTKTLTYHCYTSPKATDEIEQHMINEVARGAGAPMEIGEMHAMWGGYSSIARRVTQIRLK